MSDKYITQHDFLHSIELGDLVLADRGFNIAEDLALYGAKLVRNTSIYKSPVYTRPLTWIPIRIKLIQVCVNTLIQIAIRVT